MKSKKNNKNILLGSLSIVGLGSILGTSLLANNNETPKPIENTLISVKEHDSELLDTNQPTSAPTPRISQFLGTELLKADVIALEWHTKTDITLQDWADWAPNVVTISPFATSGTADNAAFANNTNLINIEIPRKVKTINYTSFFNASSLRSVTFEEGSEMEFVGIHAFSQCGLTTIDLPNSVNHIGHSAFRYSKIQTIKIPDDVTVLRSETFFNSELREITFGEGSQLISLEGKIFENTKLTAIDVPNTVTTINDRAFSNTSTSTGQLRNIKMLDVLKGTNPTVAKYGFNQSQWNGIEWKSFSIPFMGTILTKFEVTALGWDRKTRITQDDWGTFAPRVTQISAAATTGSGGGAAFASNSTLTEIFIPSRIKQIHYATFYNTPSLNTVTFQAGSRLEYVGNGAFRQSNISTLDLPNSVTYIGELAFDDSQLTSLHIPDNVQVIPQNTFRSTRRLTTITFGENSRFRAFHNTVFSGSSISSIYLPNSTVQINNNTFQNTANLNDISMLISFKNSAPSTRYGFTQTQFNNIKWRYLTPFLGTTLTKTDVANMGWDVKTTITLADWANDAPNVTQISGGSQNNAAFSDNNILQSIEIPATVNTVAFASFLNTGALNSVVFEAGSQVTEFANQVFRYSNVSTVV
ncbi:MAG: leucine-rich repeat protein, partial [Metamycoplasmataceae bacterium]